MPLPPPPPPAAPPPPPPPVPMTAPPPKTKDRSALLQDIHKGKRLRKVETNDRSAPVVDGKASGGSSANANSRPGPASGTKFQGPATPSGPTSFADELNRRLGGGGIGRVGKNVANGNGHTTEAGTSSASGANGASRPLPPPPPPSGPSISAKPVKSQAPRPAFGAVKQMAPQPARNGIINNGAVVNRTNSSESKEDRDIDGRFRGPSVKDKRKMFTNANMAAPPPPLQTLKQRLSNENTSNDQSNWNGTYATKMTPPPPPPAKPPSKPPQKDTRFLTLNPTKMKQQHGTAVATMHRRGSHETLSGAAAADSPYPPAPPPKLSTARSPGSVARPAPPPPGRPPPPPPERPQVAPPPPPPVAPASVPQKVSQHVLNGRNTIRNNGAVFRSPCVDNSPAPPPRRESLAPDLERRFNFLALHELPSPDAFRGVVKIYARSPQSQQHQQQQRSRAPEPPSHR